MLVRPRRTDVDDEERLALSAIGLFRHSYCQERYPLAEPDFSAHGTFDSRRKARKASFQRVFFAKLSGVFAVIKRTLRLLP